MKIGQFLKNCLEYFLTTEPGSIINTNKLVSLNKGEVYADLHAHPKVKNFEDLLFLLDVMDNKNLRICGAIEHLDTHEDNFQAIKYLAEKYGFLVEEKENILKIRKNTRDFFFIQGLEIRYKMPGIEGACDLVCLAPEKGFRRYAKENLSFNELIKICKDYDAITIATHPYTIYDPYGPRGIFRFRLANEEERKIIANEVFPKVDTIDLVATNCAWMIESNKLAARDYEKFGKPLASSDAHCVSKFTTKELGRAGVIFKITPHLETLKKYIKNEIENNNFKIQLDYTPSLQFFRGVVLGAK